VGKNAVTQTTFQGATVQGEWKFSSLGVLPAAGAIPVELARPFVTKVTKGIETVAEAESIVRASNVQFDIGFISGLMGADIDHQECM
jgi:hypothetical protein